MKSSYAKKTLNTLSTATVAVVVLLVTLCCTTFVTPVNGQFFSGLTESWNSRESIAEDAVIDQGYHLADTSSFTRFWATQSNDKNDEEGNKCCPRKQDIYAGISSCCFCGCFTFWVKILCIYPCYLDCPTSNGCSCSCNCCSILCLGCCGSDSGGLVADAPVDTSGSAIVQTNDKCCCDCSSTDGVMTNQQFACAIIKTQIMDSLTVGACFGIENCTLHCCAHAVSCCMVECVFELIANIITCVAVSVWEIFSYGFRLYGPCFGIKCAAGCCETGTYTINGTTVTIR